MKQRIDRACQCVDFPRASRCVVLEPAHAAEGAVEIRSKRRIVVPPMSAGRFADLLRCRELLEPEAAAPTVPEIRPPLLMLRPVGRPVAL